MNTTTTQTQTYKRASSKRKQTGLSTPFMLLVSALLFTGFQARSQDSGIDFGINLEVAMPMGDMGEFYKFGIGGNVAGLYSLSEELALTASLGYLSFSGDDIDLGSFGSVSTSFGAVPLRLGGKYFFSEHVFAQAKLGLAFATGGGGGGSMFIYSPGIGAKFNQFEAALKYEGWSKNGTLSFIGLRVGYFF